MDLFELIFYTPKILEKNPLVTQGFLGYFDSRF